MTENKRPSDEDLAAQEAMTEEELEAAADALLDDEDFVEEEMEMDPIEELATENADLKDRLLRAFADTDNLRKRAEREKAEATLYAATNFAKDLLSVSDSMGKALEMMPEEARNKADEATRNLIEGIELTRRELLNTFQKYNITELDPTDEKFDPNYHQAMFEVPDTGKPGGTVVQVVQTGFKIGERILRPALVGVAKGETGDKK